MLILRIYFAKICKLAKTHNVVVSLFTTFARQYRLFLRVENSVIFVMWPKGLEVYMYLVLLYEEFDSVK